MNIKTFAAIDVGSFETTMKIFEFSGKNNMREIDCVSRRLDLGSDAYSHGKISHERMDELCRTLKEFSGIMKTYRVEGYRAYGTSAIRESRNTAIILDQIEQRTGIVVEALSNAQQRFLDYKSVAAKGEAFRKIIEEKTAILDIGGGSIQLSLFDNDTLVSTENLKLGVLRLQENLNRMQVKRHKIETSVTEMAMPLLEQYKKLYLKDREIRNLIVIDDYISPWAVKKAGKSNKAMIASDELEWFEDHLKEISYSQTSHELGISEERIPLLFISEVLIRLVVELMGVKRIWVPGVTLSDGIAYEYAENIKMFRGEHDFDKDILACASNLSKRYMSSKRHTDAVAETAEIIFHSLKKEHGLGKRELMYLKLAAVMKDCGQFVSFTDIGKNSYHIIMASEIVGLSPAEREIVANVVRYTHEDFGYYETDDYKLGLNRDTYLVIAKLTAILRLAAALNRGQNQKLVSVKANVKEQQLLITADSDKDTTLEKGYMKEMGEFFREVFHLEPVLKTGIRGIR